MNLPFIKKPEQKKDFFLALILKPHGVASILFEEVNAKLVILASKEEKLKEELEFASEETLIDAIDKVISSVEESLPEKASVSKTIFAVPYPWVMEGKIKKEYLGRLKNVCQSLELTPIGFIVSVEAIAAQLQRKQGAPLSSVFVEYNHEKVFVYIVKADIIVEVKHSSLDESVVKTTDTILKRIEKVDVLPPKIILFNSENAQQIQQAFLTHPWTQHLSFLHLPQVEVLEKGFENEAIINGVATQMGFEVLASEKEALGIVDSQGEETSATAVIPMSEFGFHKEEDIALIDEQPIAEIMEKEVTNSTISHEEKEQEREDSVGIRKDISSPMPKEKKGRAIFGIFAPILAVLKGSSIQSLPIQIMRKVPKKGVLILPLLVGLIAGFIYLYYSFIIRATIIVFADKKIITNNSNITLSSRDKTSFNDKILRMNITTEEIDASDSITTTGKKDTGESAKGSVTLYSRIAQDKTFPEGTVIKSSNGLEYSFDASVKVASSSGDASASPTTVKVAVTAKKFGTEYNLPSGTKFNVSTFSSADIIAKNDSAFSGGTKKNIQVVAAKDLETLKSKVLASASDKAVTQVTEKLKEEATVIPNVLSTAFIDQSFDKKAGEEAKSVQFTAKISVKVGSYKKTDLTDFTKDAAKGKIPDSYSLVSGESKTEIKDIKITKNDNATASIYLEGVYVPKIDAGTIAITSKGKSIESAQKSIKSIIGVSDVTVKIQNSIPFLPKMLPLSSNNITIEIKN